MRLASVRRTKKQRRHVGNKKLFPKYRILASLNDAGPSEVCFRYGDGIFATKIPVLFGGTATQKSALKWASQQNLPPVISVQHDPLMGPDRESFLDANNGVRCFDPHAMTLVALECLGEKEPRIIKVYWCDIISYNETDITKILNRKTGTYIVSLQS